MSDNPQSVSGMGAEAMTKGSGAFSIVSLLPALNAKVLTSIQQAVATESELATRVEIRSRAVALLGEILRDDANAASHRRELVGAFDELFADLTTALYLSAGALDVPARIMLRRSLELGIAVVFLWDRPFDFYNWRQHDHDLSFRDMIEEIGSHCYVTMLRAEGLALAGQVWKWSEVDQLYGELSDAMHAKMHTFGTAASDRYTFSAPRWADQLTTIQRVQDLLLQLWRSRFPAAYEQLMQRIPALRS